MITPQIRKMFFWIFGLLFSIAIYFLLQKFSSNPTWVTLAISLIVIFLFYIVGEILAHISGIYFYLLNNKNSKELLEIARQEEEKQKIHEVVKKLKNTMSFVISQNYSEESIKMLNEYVGINSEETYKLIEITKKLIKVKWTYWLFGLMFSIMNVFLIFFVDYFSFLRYPIYVPILINIIIFVLFYIEGLLVMRLPDNFYLKILNLKQKKVKEKTIKKKEILETKQKMSVESIKTAIRYLLKIKVPKDKIITIITNQGFSKKAAEEIMMQITDDQINTLAKLPEKKGSALEKVFVSKIYEEFMKLKEVNQEINSIKENLSKVEDRQKEIEQNLKSLKSEKPIIGNENTEKYFEKPKITNQIKAEKGFKFSKDVYFLYNLILPQAAKYKKEDIQSFLLYQNYSLETVEDLMELFKQNNVKFKEKDSENKIISFINRLFDKS
ncbi:MAG TPA: hypothetical protein PK685_01160 [archaeon]|nr:hypothetical protein [archaeon]